MGEFIKLHSKHTGARLHMRKNAVLFVAGRDGWADVYIGDDYISVKETAEEIMAMLEPQPVPLPLTFEVKITGEPRTYTWHEAMEDFDRNPGSEWRLPTKEELNQMYENHEAIGNFADVIHWSSSEYFGNYSWTQQFSDGAQSYNAKNNSYAVRLVLKGEHNA